VRTVIGDILPFAVVVMVSPINIVAAILLLFSNRPIINASWYLAGFLAGVTVVVTLLIVLADALGLSSDSDRSRAVSGILVALGAYLLFVAYRKFRSRSGPNDDPALPAWMDGIAGFGPARSLATGAGIGAGNPKNIAVGLGTAVAVSSAGLTVADQIVTVAIYVVLASLGVATPIVVMLVLGERAPAVLEDWKEWLTRHNTAMMAVIFLFFGVFLIGKNLGGL
jgi:cytochrome c biogenesis protein CcdA